MARIILSAFILTLFSGCVSRTVSSEPKLSDLNRGKGFDGNDRIVTKKIVWIWQDEFHNPK